MLSYMTNRTDIARIARAIAQEVWDTVTLKPIVPAPLVQREGESDTSFEFRIAMRGI